VARFRFEVRGTWDGGPLAQGELARVELTLGDSLEIDVEATAYGDPAPAAPPGRCDGLWEFEVVELFLLGAGERYLELELGPHGHYLALRLEGRRRVVAADLALDFEVVRRGPRWHGRARGSRALVPEGLRAANVYAIHGAGAARRYLAGSPVPGPAPDFHRIEHFAPLPPERTGDVSCS
jgi:hypothetical protein